MSQQALIESEIQAALDRCVAAGAPGAVIAIDAPVLGISFYKASGLFERQRARLLRPEDPFRAASVTKAVTAATAVRLAAEGRWDLDAPVAPFLPPHLLDLLRELDRLPNIEALTVRRLLDHTSGLPDYFFDDAFQARVQADPDRMWQPSELVQAALEKKRLDFPPGTDFSYGDTGYVLAGLAIERLTGEPLAQVYRSRIFVPLKMDTTYLEWHEPPRGSELSHHYDGDRDLLTMNTSFDWAGGGVVSTAGELVKFLRGLFNGALLDEAWLTELTTWRDDLRWRPGSSARYLRYGLGVGMNLACGEEIIGATGVWGAFAYYWRAAGAAIAGTLNLRGADRAALLDSVVCALRQARS